MMYATRAFIGKSEDVMRDFRRYYGRYNGGLVSLFAVLWAVYIPLLLALDLVTLPLQIVGATIAWSMNRSDLK